MSKEQKQKDEESPVKSSVKTATKTAKNYIKVLDNDNALEVVYSPIPPTENRIRVVRRYGRKRAGIAYTKEAQDYKKTFIDFCRNHFTAINRFTKRHKDTDVYVLTVVLVGDTKTLLNKTWLSKGKAKAKSPYKKLDVGNRRKLIEDALSEVLGIDDSVSFEIHLKKRVDVSAKKPFIKLVLSREDPGAYGIPEEYYNDKN